MITPRAPLTILRLLMAVTVWSQPFNGILSHSFLVELAISDAMLLRTTSILLLSRIQRYLYQRYRNDVCA